MYLKHFLLSLIALSVLTFSAAQPLNRSFHRQPINLGDQLLPTSISGSWLIGGSAGQYMGYPVFRPWLALADATGGLLWERYLDDSFAAELGRVNSLSEDALGEVFYVAGSVSGCDYLIPGFIYMLDKDGQALWFKESELFFNPMATALPLQGVLVGERGSGMVEWHGMSGQAVISSDFSGQFGLHLVQMLTTGLNSVALLGSSQLILTEWTDGEAQITARIQLENGKSIARAPSGQLAVLAGEKILLLDDSLNILHEQSLSSYGDFRKVSCSTNRCYVGGQSPEGRYIALALDAELNHVRTIGMGPNYNYPSGLVAVENGFVALGTALRQETEATPFSAPNVLATSEGSDIFLRSWDAEGTPAASQRNIAVEAITVDQYEVLSFPEPCYNSPDGHMQGQFSGVNVEVRNEGPATIGSITLNTVFLTCWSICYTQQNISRTFEGLSLAPGESTTLSFGDIQTWPLPLDEMLPLCIWASGPDGQLDDDFSDNTSCFNVVVSDVEPANSLENIVVFPNPASGWLAVQYPNPLAEIAELKILTPLGQCLYREAVSAGLATTQLNVGQLPAGLYYLNIQNERGNTVIPWVKK
ncbi:MAG: T9SS type A sorting domain-containing protein [Phaeodactylibacter sp.]|nr:T9SS type A sorting domain-containing protein [Phaeodactylibacter sp.]MCB9287490.1 T9SS type A sorting domain-containing protein [Lewinellaceae bacterium]